MENLFETLAQAFKPQNQIIMESKYTKGEWVTKEDPHYPNRFDVFANQVLVSTVWAQKEFRVVETPVSNEVKQNALLIAAAPDLLEAVQGAESIIVRLLSIIAFNNCPYEKTDTDKIIFESIQASISKATTQK